MGMIWLNLHHRPCHLLRRRTFAFAWYPRHTRPLHEFALNTSLREQQNSHESMVHLSKQHMIVEDKRGDTLFYIDVHGLYISVFSQTKHKLNILEHDIFYLCMHVCMYHYATLNTKCQYYTWCMLRQVYTESSISVSFRRRAQSITQRYMAHLLHHAHRDKI